MENWNYKPIETINQSATQKDWIQTLITKFNIIGARTRLTYTGNQKDIIKSPSKFKPLFESLEYYNSDSSIIANRFTVVFDDNIKTNSMFLQEEEIQILNYESN